MECTLMKAENLVLGGFFTSQRQQLCKLRFHIEVGLSCLHKDKFKKP